MQIEVGGHNDEGKFNKPLNLFKASIQLREDFTHEASTSKKGHSAKGKKPLQVPSKGKKPLHAHMPKGKGRSHCHMQLPPMLMETINLSFLLQVGHIKWNCK